MLLAQAAPQGTENFLAIAFYLIGGVTAVVLLFKTLKKPEAIETEIGGQPIKVKFAAQFATKEELTALQDRVQRFEDSFEENFRLLTTQIREDNDGLHNRITELFGSFRELRGAVTNAMKDTNNPFGK